MSTDLDELGPRTAEERARWVLRARILIGVVWVFTLTACGFLIWSAFG